MPFLKYFLGRWTSIRNLLHQVFFPQKVYIYKKFWGQDISHDGHAFFSIDFFMGADKPGQDLEILWGGIWEECISLDGLGA